MPCDVGHVWSLQLDLHWDVFKVPCDVGHVWSLQLDLHWDVFKVQGAV